MSGVLALGSCPEPVVHKCMQYTLSGFYCMNPGITNQILTYVDETCAYTICVIECICITRLCEVFY